MKPCIDCGNLVDENELSRKGRCAGCVAKIMNEVCNQMAARAGPYYEKWLLAKQKAIKNYRDSMEKAVKKYAEALDTLEHLASPQGQVEMLIRINALHAELEQE